MVEGLASGYIIAPMDNPPLTLALQKKNLATALQDAGVEFSDIGNSIVLRYTMERPLYLEKLDTINSVLQALMDGGKLTQEINFVRGPDLDGNLDPIDGREMLAFHFGSEEEFELLREGTYPGQQFIGRTKEG